MGCDGGTIPRRDELVRVAKKPEQKDKESELAYRWRHCAITQQPLQEPIVACGLGRLYSKQNVIERLLEPDTMPESARHIRSLRDVRTLTMARNPAYDRDGNQAEGGLDVRSAPFICKLIGLEMTGKYRFVALWSCGCVYSERALKEIISASSVCSLCQKPFTDEDVITLNPTDDQTVEDLLAKIHTRAAKLKAGKKDKKASKKAAAAAVAESIAAASVDVKLEPSETSSSSAAAIGSTAATSGPSSAGSSKNTGDKVKALAAASGSGSGKPTVKVSVKRERETGTGAPSSVQHRKDNVMADPELKRLKSDGEFSVASDPKASDVYKSLFTSHKSEQEQTRAHWVTYNPFYN